MAGIGFELRKLLDQGTVSASVRAYSLGAVMALGPFISSVLCLAGLTVLSAGAVDDLERQAFAGAIVHIFSISLVGSALLQVVLTRYLSDQLYRGEQRSLVESLFPVLTLTATLVGAGAWMMLVHTEVSLLGRILVWATCVTLGMMWQVLVMITAAEGHRTLLVSFSLGTTVALVTGVALGRAVGFEGMLGGYAVGQALVLAVLVRRLLTDFGVPSRWDWGVLGYCGRYPALVAVGFLLVLGSWVDKWIFWTSELSTTALGLVTAPKYDSSIFLGFLTALPAMVHFYVRIEADFCERFHHYFDEIFFHGPLVDITARAEALRSGIWSALADTVKLQSMVSLVAAYLGPELLGWCGLPLSQVGIFRLAVVGSLFYALMLFCVVVLLYLDQQRQVLAICALFAGANLLGSYVSLHLGYESYGIGFAGGCLLGLMAGLLLVANQLHNLEFFTFARTPVAGQRRARTSLKAGKGLGYGVYHALPAGGAAGRRRDHG